MSATNKARAAFDVIMNVDAPRRPRTTYAEVVSRLGELAEEAGFLCAKDLPPLETDELAAALTEYPKAFIDGLADLDTTRDTVTNLLGRRTATRSDQHAFVGYAIVAALSDYLRPVVWKDVESARETLRRQRVIERDSTLCEVTTP